MSRPLIEISNLKKAFGQNVVLKDITLAIERGQVVAMIGPSGSGKSTLLRCINLLSIPNGGRITVGEQTIEFNGAHTALPTAKTSSTIVRTLPRPNRSPSLPTIGVATDAASR